MTPTQPLTPPRLAGHGVGDAGPWRLRGLRAAWPVRAAHVVTWAVLLAALAALLATVAVPRLTGADTYTVLTSSMSPDLPEGTLLVVRAVKPRDVAVGDVITYQLRPDRPEVVSHRVVSRSTGDDGRLVFGTQGDANDVPDSTPVRPVQVRGELWYSVPYAGHVAHAVSPGLKAVLTTGLVVILFGYALVMALAALREGISRRGDDS